VETSLSRPPIVLTVAPKKRPVGRPGKAKIGSAAEQQEDATGRVTGRWTIPAVDGAQSYHQH